MYNRVTEPLYKNNPGTLRMFIIIHYNINYIIYVLINYKSKLKSRVDLILNTFFRE